MEIIKKEVTENENGLRLDSAVASLNSNISRTLAGNLIKDGIILLDEKVVKVFAVDDKMPKGNLLFLTKYGMIKKTPFSEYGLLKTAFQAMKLKDDDVITDIVAEIITTARISASIFFIFISP